jgi:hypothetical protein
MSFLLYRSLKTKHHIWKPLSDRVLRLKIVLISTQFGPIYKAIVKLWSLTSVFYNRMIDEMRNVNCTKYDTLSRSTLFSYFTQRRLVVSGQSVGPILKAQESKFFPKCQ